MSDSVNYIVVELSGKEDITKPLGLLRSNGYKNVMCLADLFYHHTVRAHIDDVMKQKTTDDVCCTATSPEFSRIQIGRPEMTNSEAQTETFPTGNRNVKEEPTAHLMNTDNENVKEQSLYDVLTTALHETDAAQAMESTGNSNLIHPASTIDQEIESDSLSNDFKQSPEDSQIEQASEMMCSGLEQGHGALDVNESDNINYNKMKVSKRASVKRSSVNRHKTVKKSKKAVKAIKKPRTGQPKQHTMSTDMKMQLERCQVCYRAIKGTKILASFKHFLLRHAKTHCDQHEFSCSLDDCDYSSTQQHHVARHIQGHLEGDQAAVKQTV